MAEIPVSTRGKNGAGWPTLVTPSLLRDWPLPAPGEDKYSRGSVLVIGGARATPGAALLAGTAALRAGAGKLTLAVAESVAVQLGVALPECGAMGLPETPGGSVTAEGLDRISSYLDRSDAILVGPGLDDPDLAEELLRALLEREEGRGGPGAAGGPAVVLDAYALGGLVKVGDLLEPWMGRLILTPNPKEAAVLLGREVEDLEADVAEIAAKYRAVVSCQGLITRPPGDAPEEPELWKITTGYGGLGTSGSGDVLAGAIAGLRARGTSEAQAACWGTHLHAAAADRLASRLGPLGFLARELADEVPALMLELNT
ncbi:NAD(P)H-hydrate dehydratase [Pseudarthrobacter phenanthrenivorans]|uniref:NAD(P)H-hydrate dehydratase n=1 Tax=Pseudarthrobacter phenanthrenivorans TaxID=361575 RepID=UPI00112A6941|nr:NAD(P)H-hydrate dehydratase [Pseudarthrobacter phenanthrenivorans]TPV52481.1 NAD(P)H-hydrate dehydratase [Pseudarthrobacter phenanthrenivorans]